MVNNVTPREAIDAWTALFKAVGVTVAVWNLSLMLGISLNHRFQAVPMGRCASSPLFLIQVQICFNSELPLFTIGSRVFCCSRGDTPGRSWGH